MKALILEDNFRKLEQTLIVLRNYSLEHAHYNNLFQVYCRYLNKKLLDYFDLIILDLCFFVNKPLSGGKILPSREAGFHFLVKMAEMEYHVPVIIFSSEEKYLPRLETFLFPSFNEYCSPYQNVHIPKHYLEEHYKLYIERNKKLLTEIDTFVIGHAHNRTELDQLVKDFVESK